MAIVRADRRQSAIEAIAEIRESLGDTLIRVDAIQASLDDLEFMLGLASEGEQEGRERYTVMHFPEGSTEGHSIDGCEDRGCGERHADELVKDLGGNEREP